MRISSTGEPRSRATRKSVFARLLEALHRSRRRDTIRVLRRYRHLIVAQEQICPAKSEPGSRQTETGCRNADRNTPLVRSDRKAARDRVRVT
jgi:hypothetical protein